ncbi:MAG: acetylserotonin O-methyltransferase [Gammaproteobacteria bacterium]|nr:acetylserotonin O-methyltransferase [Gammaproteobacteria bacterium]
MSDGAARPDTVRLQRIMKGFWESAALMSAVELGVFTAIAKGADSLDALAAAADIEAVNAERLLTALTAMQLVERKGDRFTNSADVERFLVEGEPSYAGPWMLFGKPRWQGWGELTQHLRQRADAQRVLGMYDETFTVERARQYHEATYSVGMGAARRFHRQVDLGQRRRIMDLGGGSGCYCIVAAQRYPELTAVVLDLPPVVEVTRDFLAANEVDDRVTAKACDFTADPLPEDADVAIMASNLPQYSREIIAGVVARVHNALVPGGEFHLIGEMLDADRRGPLAPALWGLSEAVSGSTGLAHSVPECLGYLRAAGFAEVEAHEFIPETLTRVTGRKL